MVDLLSLNLIPHIVLFMFQFPYVVQKWGLYLKQTEWRMSPLLLKCSLLKEIINKYWPTGGIKFQYIRLFINLNSSSLITPIVLLISWLPDIEQKCFCTPDKATDPIFEMRYVSAIYRACSWRYYSNNLGDIFFGTPCRVTPLQNCFQALGG